MIVLLALMEEANCLKYAASSKLLGPCMILLKSPNVSLFLLNESLTHGKASFELLQKRPQETNNSLCLGKKKLKNKKKWGSQFGFMFFAFLFAADTAFPIEKEL